MSSKPCYAEVAVSLPLLTTFTYRVPERWRHLVRVGQQVVVPLGPRRVNGYVVGLIDRPPAVPGEIRELVHLGIDEPSFAPTDLAFFRWLSSYYLCGLGEVLRAATPQAAATRARRRAFVTEAGRQALAQGDTDPEAKALLAMADSPEGVSKNRWRQMVSTRRLERLAQSLVARGWIQWVEEVQPPEVKPRHLQVAKMAAPISSVPADEMTAPERKILALVQEQPRLVRDLEKEAPHGRYYARKLAKRGLIEIEKQQVFRDARGPALFEVGPQPVLTPEQRQVVEQITAALEEGTYKTFLLHGVTGSGKTEVYLAAAAKAAQLQRQTLILVPEIGLSAQLETLVRSRFHSRVAVLHSGLGGGERRDEWLRVRQGQVDVVVGARSAVFAPLERLGLVVVDEEHDRSYKQEGRFSYHARDAAVMRARLTNGIAVLGSATPSLNSYHNALSGKYRLLRLPQRIDQRPLPRVRVVDMRSQPRGAILSLPLRRALKETLAAGEQALLLQNRRGFASILICRRCGHVRRCLNCDFSLTYHQEEDVHRCHLCGLEIPASRDCGACGAPHLVPLAPGTERVAAEISKLLPGARVARMDRDTTRTKGAARRLLRDLATGKTQVLVGTQMIAKGHDFPNITLVGVVDADTGLHWPEFGAAETTFQLLTQVAGRAGRGCKEGRVLVQTFNPDHYSICCARAHDFLGFYREESRLRRALGFPPFSRLIILRLAGNVAAKVEEAAGRIAELCRQAAAAVAREKVQVLGPVVAPLERVRGKFRYQVLLKATQVSILRQVAAMVLEQGKYVVRGRGVDLIVDVDPQSLL